jgi:hypothetical protein
MVQKPTLRGQELHGKYSITFKGPGHDEKFITSISLRAFYFGISHDELIDKL